MLDDHDNSTTWIVDIPELHLQQLIRGNDPEAIRAGQEPRT